MATNQSTTRTSATESEPLEDGMDQQDVIQQLQATAAESYEKLTEAAAQLADQAQSLYDSSTAYVRENPGAYVLGAFALGCFLGVLLGRD